MKLSAFDQRGVSKPKAPWWVKLSVFDLGLLMREDTSCYEASSGRHWKQAALIQGKDSQSCIHLSHLSMDSTTSFYRLDHHRHAYETQHTCLLTCSTPPPTPTFSAIFFFICVNLHHKANWAKPDSSCSFKQAKPHTLHATAQMRWQHDCILGVLIFTQHCNFSLWHRMSSVQMNAVMRLPIAVLRSQSYNPDTKHVSLQWWFGSTCSHGFWWWGLWMTQPNAAGIRALNLCTLWICAHALNLCNCSESVHSLNLRTFNGQDLQAI